MARACDPGAAQDLAPLHVTTGGQAAAIAALGDEAFVAAAARIICTGGPGSQSGSRRSAMRAAGGALEGQFRAGAVRGRLTAEAAYQGLMERGYIVRWLPGQGLPHGLRITIGTEAETRGVADAAAELGRRQLMLPCARVRSSGWA
jgi:histidinol-phosphate aminotransferase